jgi:hypothetical protein
MTLGRRHALGLGLLLALVVEPPLLQPFLSAETQQPVSVAKGAAFRSLSDLRWNAQELKLPSPWTAIAANISRGEAPD